MNVPTVRDVHLDWLPNALQRLNDIPTCRWSSILESLYWPAFSALICSTRATVSLAAFSSVRTVAKFSFKADSCISCFFVSDCSSSCTEICKSESITVVIDRQEGKHQERLLFSLVRDQRFDTLPTRIPRPSRTELLDWSPLSFGIPLTASHSVARSVLSVDYTSSSIHRVLSSVDWFASLLVREDAFFLRLVSSREMSQQRL